MKEFKKNSTKHFPVRHFLTIMVTALVIFSLFIVYSQVTYPFTNYKMNRYRFSQPGDQPLMDGFSVRHYRFVDQVETDKLHAQARSAVPPVCLFDQKKGPAQVEKFERFQEIMLRSSEESIPVDDIQDKIVRRCDVEFDESFIDQMMNSDSLSLLLEKSHNAVKNLSIRMIFPRQEGEQSFYHKGQMLRIVKSGRSDALFEDLSFDEIPTEQVEIRREISRLRNEISPLLVGDAALILQKFTIPNTEYSSSITRKSRRRAAAQVQPIRIEIAKGEQIFSEGVALTPQQAKKIRALSSFNARFEWNKIVFLLFYLLVTVLFSFILFHPPFIRRKLKINEMNIMLGLLVGGILYSILASHMVPPFMAEIARYFATPLIVIVVSVMVSPRGGFFFGLIFVFFQPLIALFARQNGIDPGTQMIASILFGVVPSLASAWLVRKLRTLFDFLKYGIMAAGVVTLLSALFVIIAVPYELEDYQIILFTALNGVFITIMAPGLVLFFERFFDILTTHRLVELADTSQPVFRQMISRAPGTYAHSMAVANLAESACQAIGANGLLARVGGYYHDIGKVDQPEYFVENQRFGNKHDDLKPNLSVTVIKSHVKKGLERGTQLKLPQEIIDIIAQHHGNSLILYFYAQAMVGKEKSDVLKDDYRYESPSPTSIEAAVVMLADCVEAAARSLKNPTPVELEKFVWKIMLDKLLTEQLNNSGLTFVDLKRIKEVFISILGGQYHSRIEYPKENKGE